MIMPVKVLGQALFKHILLNLGYYTEILVRVAQLTQALTGPLHCSHETRLCYYRCPDFIQYDHTPHRLKYLGQDQATSGFCPQVSKCIFQQSLT